MPESPPPLVCLAGMVSPLTFPPLQTWIPCLPVDNPSIPTYWTHGACDENKAICFIPCTILHSPPRLSILITIWLYKTQYKVINVKSCLLSTSLIPLPEAEEGRHTNPSSYTIKTLYLPFLICQLNSAIYLEKLFLPFHPIVFRLGLLGGPVLCVPPTVYYPIIMLPFHFPP